MAIYRTFEELVAAAQAQGATHVTMGNYHDGAFWIYGGIKLHKMEQWEKDILADILGKDWEQDDRRLTHIAHFHDGACVQGLSFVDWNLSEWADVWDPKHPDSKQFIPIELAVKWYHEWNHYYEGTLCWYRLEE